jgi:hypothetical protein
MLVLLIGGIHIVILLDGLSCHDVHTKFHGNRLRRLKLMAGYTSYRSFAFVCLCVCEG